MLLLFLLFVSVIVADVVDVVLFLYLILDDASGQNRHCDEYAQGDDGDRNRVTGERQKTKVEYRNVVMFGNEVITIFCQLL